MMMIGCTIHFFFLSFSWYGISFTKKGFYFVWFEAKCVLVSVYLCVCVFVCNRNMTFAFRPWHWHWTILSVFFGQFQFFFCWIGHLIGCLVGGQSVVVVSFLIFFLLILEPKKKVFSVFVWLHNKKKKKSSIWSIKKKNGRTD